MPSTGYDSRLPNASELQSIVNHTRAGGRVRQAPTTQPRLAAVPLVIEQLTLSDRLTQRYGHGGASFPILARAASRSPEVIEPFPLMSYRAFEQSSDSLM